MDHGLLPHYPMSYFLSGWLASPLTLPFFFPESPVFPRNFLPGNQLVSFLLTNKSNTYSQHIEGLLHSTSESGTEPGFYWKEPTDFTALWSQPENSTFIYLHYY